MFTFHSLEGQFSCEHLEFSGTHSVTLQVLLTAQTRFLHGFVVVQHYLCSQVLIHTIYVKGKSINPLRQVTAYYTTPFFRSPVKLRLDHNMNYDHDTSDFETQTLLVHL